MGYSDRDYMKPGFNDRPPGMPSFFDGAPVTKWLLISNIAIVFLQALLTTNGDEVFLRSLGYFSIEKAIYDFQIWRFLTFQFMHGDFWHLISNCIGLLVFGPHIERWMTSRAYIVFYLLCGVAGVLFYAFLFYTPGFLDGALVTDRMIGASAGVFGILAAFYFVAPNARILLFFVFPIQIRTLAIVYFIIAAYGVIFNTHNAGGSAGHLGGAFFGLAVLKWPPLKEVVIKLSQIGEEKKPRKSSKVKDAKVLREKERSPLELTKEVDRILDKISEHGIQSLTPKEKETLNKARRDK